MTNPSRAKGTAWEVELVDRLRTLFGPQVERAPLKGIHDQGDFVGVPWLHEAKSTEVPHFLKWANEARRKTEHDTGLWTVLWHGDRRTYPQELVIMPYSLYDILIAAGR